MPFFAKPFMVGNRFENLSQEYKTNGWFGRREKYNARLSVYIVVIQCNKGAFLHGVTFIWSRTVRCISKDIYALFI